MLCVDTSRKVIGPFSTRKVDRTEGQCRVDQKRDIERIEKGRGVHGTYVSNTVRGTNKLTRQTSVTV